MTGQLEDRWLPVTKRVCCVNPNTSDPVFLTCVRLSGKEFHFKIRE
jgi:hypothetical protein